MFLDIGCGIFFLGLGLFFGLFVVVGFMSFVQHPETIAHLWFPWIELSLGVLSSYSWVVYLLNDSKRLRSHYECECADGFLLVRGKDASGIQVLLWENIQRLEETRVLLGKRRGRTNASLYYVYDRQGHLYHLEHRKLWKRCAEELACREVSA